MNQVVLIGRLTKDPDLRYGQGTSNAICRFTLAVDKKLSKDKKAEMEQQNKPTADFINCVAFGRAGETIANFITKGRQLAVSGRIQTGRYQAQDGTMKYTTDIVVENFDFIGGRSEGAGPNQGFNDPSDQGGFNTNYNQGGPLDEFGIDKDAFPSDDSDVPF